MRDHDLRALEPAEFTLWDKFVEKSPQGTLFHAAPWLEASGAPFRLFGFFRGGELRGGFATGVLGRRAAGHPHPALTPYLGVLLPPPAPKTVTTISNEKEIGGAFASLLVSEFDAASFRFAPEAVDLQPFIWRGFQAGVRYTYRLALGDLDAAFENMDSSLRRNLRGARKENLTVLSGAPFGEILALAEKSFHRQGIEPAFAAAARRFNGALEQAGRCRGFLTLGAGGGPAAAVWIVWDHRRAYYLVGGYDQASQSSNAMALAMWEAIQFTSKELRLPEFDFEGSMVPAVERFFRKFGGALMPTFTISYDKPPSLSQKLMRRIVRGAG